MGGNPDRPADVTARLEVRESSGKRGGTAPRRAARRPRSVPRVVGRAEDLVVTLPVGGPERDVRLAEDDRTRRLETLHYHRVAGRHVVRQGRRARSRSRTCELERFLHRAWHPVDRSPPLSTRSGLVGGLRARQNGVFGQRDDGVQPWIVLADPIQHPRSQLDRGDLAAPDCTGSREGGDEVKVGNGAPGPRRLQQGRGGQRRPDS